MCVSSEDIDYLIDYAINMCKKAIDSIVAGDISVTPLKATKSTCEYCQYKGICNYSKLYGNAQRKAEPYHEIKDLKERSGK